MARVCSVSLKLADGDSQVEVKMFDNIKIAIGNTDIRSTVYVSKLSDKMLLG